MQIKCITAHDKVVPVRVPDHFLKVANPFKTNKNMYMYHDGRSSNHMS